MVLGAVAQRLPYTIEYRIRHADGSSRWVYEQGQGVYGPDGSVQWLDGVILDITERKQADATLRQAEERLALAVEGSSDGLWDGRPLSEEPWWSPRTPVWWSPRFKELLGFRDDEFPNVLESWAARLHPDDKARVFEALTAHIDRRVPYDVEYRLRTKPGEYRWFRARGQAIWDQDGHMVRMAGSLQDVHARVQAQTALTTSEARYRALYDDQPSMFFTVDSAGIVLSVNRFGAEHLGYTVEELIGSPVLNVFDPDDRAGVGRALTQCFESPSRAHVWECRKRRKDGSRLWVRETIRVVPGPHQEALALVVCEDMTERKQAEETGRRSQALLSAILDHLPDMIFVKDAKDLRFVHFNKAGEELLGYSREELIGKCDADFFPPDEAAFFIAKDREVLGSASVVDIPEEPIQTRHKGTRWLHTKKVVIRAADGTPLYLLGISEDITERREKKGS
jgi:PAS domain S-box-containing protein